MSSRLMITFIGGVIRPVRYSLTLSPSFWYCLKNPSLSFDAMEGYIKVKKLFLEPREKDSTIYIEILLTVITAR